MNCLHRIAQLALLAGLTSCSSASLSPKEQARFGLSAPARSISVDRTDDELGYKVIFDKKGHIAEIVTCNPDGSYRCTEYYSYDENGRPIDEMMVNADDETEGRWRTDYLDNGKIGTRIFFGMNNDEQHRFTYEWEDTVLVGYEYRLEYEFMSRGEYSYVNGVQVEYVYDRDDSLVDIIRTEQLDEFRKTRILSDDGELDIEIRYNGKGLPVWSRNTRINSENGIIWDEDLEINPERFFEYSYDSRGNWTERREYRDSAGSVIASVHRKISY